MTGTMEMFGETPSRAWEPAAVELRTARDHSLTTRALEHEADALKKLAEKNQQAGYIQEARTVRADVAAIEDYILPQFKEQQEIPLATEVEVRAAIVNELRGLVHQYLTWHRNDSEGTRDEEREQELLEKLSARVERYAVRVAEAGFAAGIAAREATPEVLAIRSLRALSLLGS